MQFDFMKISVRVSIYEDFPAETRTKGAEKDITRDDGL